MDNKSASPKAGKVIRCTAAISRIPGKPLVMEEIEVEPPKAGEVRIKILCTSLCHSDVTFWKLSADPPILPLPVIFGHEAVGVVESVGEFVEEVKERDLVLPIFHRDCGECRDCKSPKSNTCSKFGRGYRPNMPRDGTSRFRDLKGGVIHHFLNISSFTEYTVVDITHGQDYSTYPTRHSLPSQLRCIDRRGSRVEGGRG